MPPGLQSGGRAEADMVRTTGATPRRFVKARFALKDIACGIAPLEETVASEEGRECLLPPRYRAARWSLTGFSY